ncbi:MAG: hypothetical protein IPO17_04445 [Flavobacteriales bacterium]|nr:hypothetical protein [Flavobacteriales bacterium]
MRSISFLILTLAFCQGLTAQQVNWLQHVGTTMHDIGSAVDLAPNGDVVVVGYYESGTPMDFDAGPGVYNYGDFGLFIARYAPTGEVLHVQHCMSSLDHGFTTIHRARRSPCAVHRYPAISTSLVTATLAQAICG